MNILVTGGTGFIGSYFIPLLLNNGHSVKLLVRDIQKAQKLFGDTCTYCIGDVTEYNQIAGCCDGIDVVYHLVAKSGNELPSTDNFKEFRRINIGGTKNIVQEAKKGHVKRFIYVSSTAAMGLVRDKPISERSKCDPYLPYQVSKYEAEEFLRKEFEENSFPVLIARPSKVYGVGENSYSYMTIAKMCKQGLIIKAGKGKNLTSNIYVSDLAEGLLKMLDMGVVGETYILSSKESIGYIETANIIAECIGKKLKVICIPERIMILLAFLYERLMILLKHRPIVTKRNIEMTINDRVYNISKAEEELGYVNNVSMKDGIKRTIEWYKHERLI